MFERMWLSLMKMRLSSSVFFRRDTHLVLRRDTHLVFGDATLAVVLETRRSRSKFVDVDVIFLKYEATLDHSGCECHLKYGSPQCHASAQLEL